MGGATRFMTLLTAPFPPLRPSLILLHRRISSLSITPLRLHTRSPLSKSKTLTPQPPSCFHSQPTNNTYALQSSAAQQQHLHHPWPEWTNFLNFLSNVQGFSAPHGDRIPPEDAFVLYEKLSDDFVSAAAACIAFSRARPDLIGLLSRKDIEAVVSNGTPFLFKSALDTARRMRAFLGTADSNVEEVDKARLTDLMKYIISYASNPTASSERNGLYSRELVDSSVRNLLHEMVTVCAGAPTGGHQFSGSDRHVPNPNGQNIEMKRGDWICQKCDFMNFARNVKCLECEEPRPKRQLIGGEWECPECSFYNYGRNTVCLRCDCRRPGAPLFNNNNSQRIGTQFSPLSQSGSSDIRYSGNNHAKAVPFVPLPADTFSRRCQTPEMDNGNKVPVEANNTASSDVRSRTAISSTPQGLSGNIHLTRDSASQIDIQNNEGEQTEKAERWFKRMAELQNAKDFPSADLPSPVSGEDFPEIMPVRKGENRFVVSKQKDRSLTSPQYKRQVAMDQANNTNFVPFVPFPPGYFANKGTEQPSGPDSPENTVSGTSFSKGREQTDKFDAKHGMANSSTVWRKDQNTRSSGDSLYTNETSTGQFGGDYSKQYSGGTVQNSFTSDTMNTNRQTGGYSGAGDASLAGHGGALSSETSAAQFGGDYSKHHSGGNVQNSFTSHTMNTNTQTGGYSGAGNASIAGHGGASSQPPKNENARTSWSGPSLEGSAVKEPDPLDMSEEAKTERWFKRVAQIKDISELSQIPDEDFPSIMPMRKGVNRFVVSKRKTPLERRLTNQQYRRNLPIVPNNPLKKEGDSS